MVGARTLLRPLRFPVCLCAVWPEFLLRARRVCPGIMTGLHVQSVDFVVHGSELYIRIRGEPEVSLLNLVVLA